MASPPSSTRPLPKEEYTPEVAEHHPADPLSEGNVRVSDDENDFETRTIQEASVSPPVGHAHWKSSGCDPDLT